MARRAAAMVVYGRDPRSDSEISEYPRGVVTVQQTTSKASP